jgi:hypothetical protein
VIAGFLEKIGGFLDKALLIAAVLPLLVIALVIVVLASLTLGVESLFVLARRIADLSVANAGALGLAGVLVLIITAFALRSLRTFTLALWCGKNRVWHSLGLHDALATRQKQVRTKLIASTRGAWPWRDAVESLSREAAAAMDEGRTAEKPSMPEDERIALVERLDLHRPAILADAEDSSQRFQALAAKVIEAYRRFSPATVNPIFVDLRGIGNERAAVEAERIQAALAELDLRFSPAADPPGTALGNVLDALDAYPVKRYRMEGSLFWAHLDHVMSGRVHDEIRDQRILLDLALTLATGFALLAAAVALVGPWLWLHPVIAVSAILCGVASWGFYRVAVYAAVGLSRAMRAGCDLFRHDVLKALACPVPTDLATERALWTQLSRLAAYGDVKGSIVFAGAAPTPPTAPS